MSGVKGKKSGGVQIKIKMDELYKQIEYVSWHGRDMARMQHLYYINKNKCSDGDQQALMDAGNAKISKSIP